MARSKKSTAVVVSNDDQQNRLASLITQQYVQRARYWKPMHDRQDYWAAMFHLMDAVQQSKPIGYFKFISNDPHTAVSAAHSMLTRNDVFWDIDALLPGMGRDERDLVSLVEGALGGIVDDFSSLFTSRGEGRFWSTVAWHALLRGWICGKFQVTEEAGRDDDVPLQGEFWDFRQSYPAFDGHGLHSCIVAKEISMAQLIDDYSENEEVQKRLQNDGLKEYELDLTQTCYKLEWWDFRRLKMCGVLAVWPAMAGPGSFTLNWGGGATIPMNGVWVQEPYEHGYDETNRPVVFTPVNGVPLKNKPQIPTMAAAAMTQRASMMGLAYPSWYGPNGWVADIGRSLLASVEEHVPQYNEILASILHKYAVDAYGTWLLKTRSGQMIPFSHGAGDVNALRLEEQVERAEVAPANPDAYRLVNLISEEKQRGTLSNILQASTGMGSASGYMFGQIRNIALNNLSPYENGMADFGTAFAKSMQGQLRDVSPPVLELVHRSRGNTFVRIEFDPAILKERIYKAVPRFEPAVPDDLPLKAQTARLLLDPRRPVMSVLDVLERVFHHPDSAGVEKRIWRDVANTDPIIVLMQVAQALREDGQEELAERIEKQEFQMKFAEEMKWRQFMAASGMPGQLPGGAETTSGAGLGPEGGGTGAPNQMADQMADAGGGAPAGESNNYSGGNA